MIQALWFLFKVGVLVALAVWVADHPGYVTIEVNDLDIKAKIHTGLFLLIMLATILLAIFIFRILKGFADFPKSWARYQEHRRREKGYRALTLGLTAVAAGDAKHAAYQAFRAEKFMPDDTGLPVLLKAQALRLQGKEEEAAQSFVRMLENPDASFLGVRGLLQAALDQGRYDQASDLAEKALKVHPGQPWILKVVYDLQIRQRHWDQALDVLKRLEKSKTMETDEVASERVCLLAAKAEEALKDGLREEAAGYLTKAYKINPNFVPVIERLGDIYLERNQRSKSVRMVEKAWKAEAHPELVKIWKSLIPSHKASDPMARIAWFEKLVKLNPGSAESHMALGYEAMVQRLWGEAREHLFKAQEIGAGARLYKLLAELEERSGQGETASRRWLEKAAESTPGKRWVCKETGRIYEVWHPVAEPHGAFNSIVWDFPHLTGKSHAYLSHHQNVPHVGMLEAS